MMKSRHCTWQRQTRQSHQQHDGFTIPPWHRQYEVTFCRQRMRFTLWSPETNLDCKMFRNWWICIWQQKSCLMCHTVCSTGFQLSTQPFRHLWRILGKFNFFPPPSHPYKFPFSDGVSRSKRGNGKGYVFSTVVPILHLSKMFRRIPDTVQKSIDNQWVSRIVHWATQKGKHRVKPLCGSSPIPAHPVPAFFWANVFSAVNWMWNNPIEHEHLRTLCPLYQILTQWLPSDTTSEIP